MEKEFCTYNQALRLKALGFKERVLTYYENGVPKLHNDITGWDFNTSFMTCVSRPTYSQAFRWFREKHNLHCAVNTHTSSTNQLTYICSLEFGKKLTYEEAELACLDKLLEIVESKQKEDGKLGKIKQRI